jgi:hypothetical protein
MKYLKEYNVNFDKNNQLLDIYDILMPLLDVYNYSIVKEMENLLRLNSPKLGILEISNSFHYGSKSILIRITEGSGLFSYLLKKGTYKNFDGVIINEYASILEDCHNRIIQYLNPVKVEVGMVGVSIRDLDLLYLLEKPNYTRYKDVDLYGASSVVELEKIGVTLYSSERFKNKIQTIDITQKHLDTFNIMGYYDGYFYNLDIVDKNIMINNKLAGNMVKWVQKEWDIICHKYNIKDMQRIRNINNSKITVAEFMVILKNNQNNIWVEYSINH